MILQIKNNVPTTHFVGVKFRRLHKIKILFNERLMSEHRTCYAIKNILKKLVDSLMGPLK